MARTQLKFGDLYVQGSQKWRAHLPHFQKAWLNPHEVHVIPQHARGWNQFYWTRFERNPWPRFRKSKVPSGSFEKNIRLDSGIVYKQIFRKHQKNSTWSEEFSWLVSLVTFQKNSETFKPKARETWVLYYRLKLQNSAKTDSIFSRIPGRDGGWESENVKCVIFKVVLSPSKKRHYLKTLWKDRLCPFLVPKLWADHWIASYEGHDTK